MLTAAFLLSQWILALWQSMSSQPSDQGAYQQSFLLCTRATCAAASCSSLWKRTPGRVHEFLQDYDGMFCNPLDGELRRGGSFLTSCYFLKQLIIRKHTSRDSSSFDPKPIEGGPSIRKDRMSMIFLRATGLRELQGYQ